MKSSGNAKHRFRSERLQRRVDIREVRQHVLPESVEMITDVGDGFGDVARKEDKAVSGFVGTIGKALLNNVGPPCLYRYVYVLIKLFEVSSKLRSLTLFNRKTTQLSFLKVSSKFRSLTWKSGTSFQPFCSFRLS
ncbi:hypothetical protein K1719_010298 [Acacia pycnantha]|nr:hypothetical protein K1719_010298 [Acacia pycnantha]